MIQAEHLHHWKRRRMFVKEEYQTKYENYILMQSEVADYT